MDVRPLTDSDRDRARALLRERWGDERMAVHGEVLRPAELDGFVAGDWKGLVTYRIDPRGCEVVSLDALEERRGVGTRLLGEVVHAARTAGCTRVWLVTTNDNLHALEWYRRRGFEVVRMDRGAVDRARRLKPSIPLVNAVNGLPLHDEIEMALEL